MNIKLFCNDGVSIIETDRGQVKVSAQEFLDGWVGNPGNEAISAPFGNTDATFYEPLEVSHYKVTGWKNDDVRARWTDASGKTHNYVVTRNGKTPQFNQQGPVPPDGAERQRLLYMNIAIGPVEDKRPDERRPIEEPAAQQEYRGRFAK